jgi:hypothetical protein
MALVNFYDVRPLDPYLFTGPSRLLAGIARTGDVSLDVQYGEYARWLYVGTSGNLSYVKWDGTTQVLANLAAGVWHPIFSLKINSSGTGATGLVWGS